MTEKEEIALRNKLHLVCDEVIPTPDDIYGYEKALAAAGVVVLDFEQFGSYQGEWWAEIQFPNGEIFFATGAYGSCSGCDAFESEFGYRDEDHDYFCQLKDFGRDYLENCFTIDQAIKEASRNLKWDHDAQEMVDWLTSKKKGRDGVEERE